jgi:Fur family peroxide stress response transcriptional regulator
MTTHIKRLFADHGLRCTQQRVSLYHALASSDRHPTADELFKDVSQALPGISLATVYNTLEAFCQAGLAQKLPAVAHNGSARFDAISDTHLHLRDQHTGEIRDVPHELGQRILDRIPDKTLRELEQSLGFKISQLQIELVGQHEGDAVEANDSKGANASKQSATSSAG